MVVLIVGNVDGVVCPGLTEVKCSHVFRYSVDTDRLQIMNVNMSDQGTYSCTAKTSLDEDTATAVLTVLGETGFCD